nr:MAG TPA: hypothetical protein [Caudoviricetes sp.]
MWQWDNPKTGNESQTLDLLNKKQKPSSLEGFFCYNGKFKKCLV